MDPARSIGLDTDELRPRPTLTAPQTAERAGVSVDFARRLQRALGLPEVEDDEVAFDERHIAVLKDLKGIADAGVPVEDIISVARVYGYAMSRIADAETRVFAERFIGPDGEARTQTQPSLAEAALSLLDALGRPLEYAHRLHLAAALQHLEVNKHEEGESLTVGFADLVDFSRITDDLPGAELSRLVERFEDLVVRVCADSPARMVKTIGDAVMFVAGDAGAAVDVAMAIIAAVQQEEEMPAARAGLDRGEVVPLGGDYFGRPVNVAARITAFARPGTVVVSEAVLDHEPDRPVSKIGSQRLKGVGRVRLFKLRDATRPNEHE